MTLTIVDKNAFVRVGKCTYICIGSEEAVSQADTEQLTKMVQIAMAMSGYNAIRRGYGFTLH